MKTLLRTLVVFPLLFAFAGITLAATNDLVLSPGNIRFSAITFLEGKSVRIYATITNPGGKDLRGVVRFYDGKNQIQGDQPISVLASRDDSVFVDWKLTPGTHTVKVVIFPFENAADNPSNNVVEKTITVQLDSDQDGIPNALDPDDDNDKVPDDKDTFPLDRKESVDTDGDSIGNNKDPDDDNDGLSDEEEKKLGTDDLLFDTDGDSANDKNDPYPTDPSRQNYDYDQDGLEDEKDEDADNDGVPKSSDFNDTNSGPIITITSKQKPIRRIVFPEELVQFETAASIDPDGKITGTEWEVDNETNKWPSLDNISVKFSDAWTHTIKAKVTDDKGESREKIFTVFVVPRILPWLAITAVFLILILALFFIFSYTRRRRSSFQKISGFLNTIMKIIPPPRKRKK